MPTSWRSEPSEDRSFPASRRGPGPPKCGRTLCKLKLVQVVRGATQTACRLLDVGDAELARIIRACHSSDEVRDPHGKRAPKREGAPTISKSSGHWPGVKAPSRPARVLSVAEPQDEPSGDPSHGVTALVVRFDGVPAAPPGATVPRVCWPDFVWGCVACGCPAFPAACVEYVAVRIGARVAVRGAAAVVWPSVRKESPPV